MRMLLVFAAVVTTLSADLAGQFAESPQAQKYVAAAMSLAGTDLVAEAKAFCTPTGPQREALARQAAGLPPIPDRVLEPIKIFDNLYYIGFNDVGAWAIPTSAGIILFDSLNNGDEARDILVPGLRKVGLDPAQIKYVIMAHGHADHYGGGRYLQDTYHPRILMGAPDWDTVVASERPDRPQMKRDMDVTDGQTITLGDTTVTLTLTPGHTPGTITMLFPVKHRGRTHTAMLFGGTQGPTPQSLATFEHVFNDFARKQNAESALGSHPGILMNTLPLMESLRDRYPTGAHPLLMGPEKFGRYLSIMLECGKARIAATTSGATQTAGPAPGETLSQSYRGSQSDNVAYQKVPPIKVFDNLYYVGPGSVSVWLIPTTDGLILVDSAQEPLVDHVIDSIRKVGFDPRNIKYILLTHGHLDHFGGAGKIQALSGARVGTLEEDWQLIEATYQNPNPGRGGARDNGVAFTRDLVIREGDTITLGKTSLKVYKLPGHTPGSASFEFTVYDNGTPHKAFIFGGPGQRNGVEGGTQFLESIRRLKREQSDVEVPIHVHSYLTTYPWPEGGAVFEPAIKLAQRRPGQPHPFVNNATWRAWLDTAEAGTLKYIEDAKAGRVGGRGQTQ